MAQSGKLIVVAVAAAGLGAASMYAWFAQRQPLATLATAGAPGAAKAPAGAPGGKPGGAAAGGGAVGVEAVPVSTVALQDGVGAVGTVRSNEAVVLRPEIPGRIAAIHFRDGAAVARGAVMLALDAATQEAELAQARANLALAEANFRRNDDLFRRKFVSERARDESAANLKVVAAAVELAEARLKKTRIVAPFAGVVGIRNVSVGDYVKEGQDLVNLEDISTLKLDFRLPEAYLPRLARGQSVEVASDSLPGRSFGAVVDAIDPQVDAAGRAVLLRARLANPQGQLRPGMFARVRLAFGTDRQALAVPEEALVPAGSDQFVFRVADGRAQRVRVQTGARRDARVEILDGLAAGDLVVTAGQLKIRDGAPVQVVAPGAAAPRAGDGAPAAPAKAAAAGRPG